MKPVMATLIGGINGVIIMPGTAGDFEFVVFDHGKYVSLALIRAKAEFISKLLKATGPLTPIDGIYLWMNRDQFVGPLSGISVFLQDDQRARLIDVLGAVIDELAPVAKLPQTDVTTQYAHKYNVGDRVLVMDVDPAVITFYDPEYQLYGVKYEDGSGEYDLCPESELEPLPAADLPLTPPPAPLGDEPAPEDEPTDDDELLFESQGDAFMAWQMRVIKHMTEPAPTDDDTQPVLTSGEPPTETWAKHWNDDGSATDDNPRPDGFDYRV